jgi:hypothetical protein
VPDRDDLRSAAEGLAEGGVVFELGEVIGAQGEFGLAARCLRPEPGREGDGAGAVADFGEAFCGVITTAQYPRRT